MCLSVLSLWWVRVSLCCPCGCEYVCVVPLVGVSVSVCCPSGGCECVCVVPVVGVSVSVLSLWWV